MAINWTEWYPLGADTEIPAGLYDLKLNDEQGQYLTEIRADVSAGSVRALDAVLSANFDRQVYTVSAKRVTPFDNDYVFLSPGDYEELIELATIGANSGNRSWKIRKNKSLFRIIASAYRSH